MSNILKETARRIRKITVDCRYDMHEPDEQEVSATVIGDHLDNAMGNHVMEEGHRQEFLVIIKNDLTGEEEKFNLANLIALARLASFDDFSSPAYEAELARAGFYPSPTKGEEGLYYVDGTGITLDLRNGVSVPQMRKIVCQAKEKGKNEVREEMKSILFGNKTV